MFKISSSFFLAGVLAIAAEINGYVDIAKISTPSAAPTSFGRLYINTNAQLACINPDSSACLPTSTVLTQGSVMFAGASGVYSQDNANFFWDATNHRLGIGKTGPLQSLDLVGSIAMSGTGSSLTITSSTFATLTVSSNTGFNAALVVNSPPTQSAYLSFQQSGTEKWQLGPNSGGAGSTGALNFFGGGSLIALELNLNGDISVGSTTDNNYRFEVGKSGSAGTARFLDSTATTGATRVVVGLGAADTAATTTLTNAGVTQSAGTNSNFFQSLGTTFTVSGCATTSALTGGATSGSFSTTNVGTCTAVVTMGSSATASHGWSCVVNDQTTANIFRQTASTTTTATLVGTSANGDVINFHCVGY